MTVVKRIAPASAFKLGLIASAILGLIAGIACSIAALTGIAPELHARMPFMHGFGALMPVLLCAMLYGIVGGIAAVIGAAMYNLASAWIGGLEVETGQL